MIQSNLKLILSILILISLILSLFYNNFSNSRKIKEFELLFKLKSKQLNIRPEKGDKYDFFVKYQDKKVKRIFRFENRKSNQLNISNIKCFIQTLTNDKLNFSLVYDSFIQSSVIENPFLDLGYGEYISPGSNLLFYGSSFQEDKVTSEAMIYYEKVN